MNTRLSSTENGKPLFSHFKTFNEFWSAVLEKAFSKCYENLVGGQMANAFQNISAGVAETISVCNFFGFEADATVTDRLFQTLK
ncbi:hypothetical protein QR680_015431 [Steinernema hermaphroditum]|uniref:Calpain catalytic domain-containing protein n=1 Tax=Steinernema hermaphroditum TaxID=289476 RepID=A0AA39LK70_9BILA|nr:hypothetical protein QR680_015431 [Steinernema hermaphroditum]